ncbi:RcpC/CpaB family pilus assembly protein [Actinoplanes sp. TRM 88003]|uniref:RcpC/CpaB family pilus assembly protein n=1 Tax=Paractinoplanes aksuensis TaxID=2939490 RepID=A0ABT1DG59_9ACTN|nr:RcpC/CpaB family pilus assembly protein [Actinoplanes aksuensis]MCO8269829.1 RcpC/CpaB family pilus assembly protein [Actinoplanes aksuensis]
MSRRVVLLGVAAMLAILSAVAVVAYASGADRRAVEGKKGVWVLLATDKIPSGTTIAQIRSRRLVRQVLMPAETVPSGALTKLDTSLDAKKLNAALNPDQMLLNGQFDVNLSPKGPAPTFSVPRGKIAISVELNVGRQVAGNVKKGDPVAIYGTQTIKGSENNLTDSYVVIERAIVITAGESPPDGQMSLLLTPSASGSAAATPSPVYSQETLKRYVVTVAVTPIQAEKLITAYNGATLHLGVLGPGVRLTPEAPPFTAEPTATQTGAVG